MNDFEKNIDRLLDEMTGSGACAARPAALGIVPNDVLFAQKPDGSKTTKKKRRKKAPAMPHTSPIMGRLPVINHTGGRLGGNVRESIDTIETCILCQDSGWIKVKQSTANDVLRAAWDAADAQNPAEDGNHTVPCPKCMASVDAIRNYELTDPSVKSMVAKAARADGGHRIMP